MTPDEIKKIFKSALKEHQSEMRIPNEQHYQDHLQLIACRESKPEWQANHQFVSSLRENGKTARGVILKLFITAIFGYFIMVFIKGWGT